MRSWCAEGPRDSDENEQRVDPPHRRRRIACFEQEQQGAHPERELTDAQNAAPIEAISGLSGEKAQNDGRRELRERRSEVERAMRQILTCQPIATPHLHRHPRHCQKRQAVAMSKGCARMARFTAVVMARMGPLTTVTTDRGPSEHGPEVHLDAVSSTLLLRDRKHGQSFHRYPAPSPALLCPFRVDACGKRSKGSPPAAAFTFGRAVTKSATKSRRSARDAPTPSASPRSPSGSSKRTTANNAAIS